MTQALRSLNPESDADLGTLVARYHDYLRTFSEEAPPLGETFISEVDVTGLASKYPPRRGQEVSGLTELTPPQRRADEYGFLGAEIVSRHRAEMVLPQGTLIGHIYKRD